MTTVILGMMVTYYFFPQNGLTFLKELSIWDKIAVLYHRIGDVSLGLFPLTIYLVFLLTQDMLNHLGVTSKPASRRGYYLLLFAAPNLGLLGTFISLGNAFNGMDIGQGLQNALAVLGVDIGQALDSTKYGISLAIITYPALLFINKDKSEDDSEV